MFKSIKSKLIGITVVIFAIFSLIIANIEANEYEHFKKTQIENCRSSVENSAKILEFTINQLENNVRSLALSAASFYFFDRNDRNFADFIIKDNFANSKLTAVGGGIWFEPFVIDKNIKRYCSYASWQGGQVVLDNNCASDEYNYLAKNWYTEVKNNFSLETKNDVTWIKPYFDEIGTKELMVTVGASIYNNDNFVGMVSVDWLVDSIQYRLESVKPTSNSIVVFADYKKDFIISISGIEKDVASLYIGQPLENIPWYNKDLQDGQVISYKSKNYMLYTKNFTNGMQLIVKVPEDELYYIQKRNLIFEILLPFLAAIILSILIYLVLTKNINKPIDILIDATNEIGSGNFEKQISITKPKEFALLAETFNTMTKDINEYLTNIKNLTYEKMQMLSDLNVAKEIQTSSLPNVFPPFPDKMELDLYATMKTAKEVGGDFYDFYFIDICHVAFTVADVSGKGVPAALFMMKAKSILKSTALSNSVIETVMEKVNNEIFANNDKNFFVTIGLGVIDITTGEVTYINAGHNPPIIKRRDSAEYVSVPANIVVGIFDEMPFESVQFKLEPLDTLFLYTDGVTEANNSKEELYGEDRLIEVVKKQGVNPKLIINEVNKSVSEFADGHEQTDDITMLALTYLGSENFIETIHIPADISETTSFLNWIENLCDRAELDMAKKSKLMICAEEIFVNIASYAYPDDLKRKEKDTVVKFRYIKPLNEIKLSFADSGIKYNPLEHEDPNVNAPLEERAEGGLGILMVKNMMDDVEYEYKNKQNVLTLRCFKE